jgi:hypothetical protein
VKTAPTICQHSPRRKKHRTAWGFRPVARREPAPRLIQVDWVAQDMRPTSQASSRRSEPLRVTHVALSLDVGRLERNIVNQVPEGHGLGQPEHL